MATAAAAVVVVTGVTVPNAHAAASATLNFDFPAEVVVGDTVVAQLKVTNTGDKKLNLTALRAVLPARPNQRPRSAPTTRIDRSSRCAKRRL